MSPEKRTVRVLIAAESFSFRSPFPSASSSSNHSPLSQRLSSGRCHRTALLSPSRFFTPPFFPTMLAIPRAAALRNVARRAYSTASTPYSKTIDNLRINADTKVIFQGFTGKQGTYVSFANCCRGARERGADLMRTVSTPSRPSNTVRGNPRYDEKVARRSIHADTATRHQGCWWNEPQEGRPDASRPARLQECQRGRDQHRRHRDGPFRPVRYISLVAINRSLNVV